MRHLGHPIQGSGNTAEERPRRPLRTRGWGGSCGARRSGHNMATALLNPQHLWLPAQDWASQPSTFHQGLGKVSRSPASPPRSSWQRMGTGKELFSLAG